MNIVFLDRTSLPASHPIPRPSFPHTWIEYAHTSTQQVYERAKEADIIITSKVQLDRKLLRALPRLKLIAITATGINNVDIATTQELGIQVKNVTGYSNISVAEHVLGMIFALKHSLFAYHYDQIQSNRWSNCGQFCYIDYPITNVRSSTLGVIGKGNLGTEVGRLAGLLGMNVLYAEHRGVKQIRDGYCQFETVLQQSDIITLHCPLTENTQHLINQETLALMKPSAYLINTGRGSLVDEAALLQALQQGKIAGAALDVLEKEPPELDNPLIQAAKYLPNLLLTPHVAWASDSAITTLVNRVAQNIEDFVAGK